jgi:hypothetical protein
LALAISVLVLFVFATTFTAVKASLAALLTLLMGPADLIVADAALIMHLLASTALR